MGICMSLQQYTHISRGEIRFSTIFQTRVVQCQMNIRTEMLRQCQSFFEYSTPYLETLSIYCTPWLCDSWNSLWYMLCDIDKYNAYMLAFIALPFTRTGKNRLGMWTDFLCFPILMASQQLPQLLLLMMTTVVRLDSLRS